MATVDARNGTTGVAHTNRKFHTITGTYDFDLHGQADIADVIQMVQIPADAVIKDVVLEVVTACTAGATCEFGITGGTTDGFLTATSVVTLGSTHGNGASLAPTTNGHFITATDSIDAVVAGANILAGKFHLHVLVWIPQD